MARDTAAPWAEEVLVTAGDLMVLSDEGRRYELVHGRLVGMAPNGLEHGALEARLGAALVKFVDERGLERTSRGSPAPQSTSEPGEGGPALGPAPTTTRVQCVAGLVTGGETGFLLSRVDEPDTVLAADIAFIAEDRLPAPGACDWRTFPRLAPNLVVEVASPSQHRPEMAVKARMWLGAGVSVVWVIWPSMRQVDVWRSDVGDEMSTLEGSDVLDGDGVLPGFEFPLARLWR